MKKKDLKRFKEILDEKKFVLLKKAHRTLSEDMKLESDDLPDEMDLASSEYLQSFTFRLRGREKTFLKKKKDFSGQNWGVWVRFFFLLVQELRPKR